MLVYQCRECGRIILPDGKGCVCGQPWGSLKVIKESDTKQKNHYARPPSHRSVHIGGVGSNISLFESI